MREIQTVQRFFILSSRLKLKMKSFLESLSYMILLIMDKKIKSKYFSKTNKFWCIEAILYWCKYLFLTFLDKWCQSPLYGRVTKKNDIYWNNNKKKLVTLAKYRLLVQKKFSYEVNFFHSLNKLNSSFI